jgi:hypothetical protein
MRDLNEGQKIAYEVVADRRTGKSSTGNLKPARNCQSPIMSSLHSIVMRKAT